MTPQQIDLGEKSRLVEGWLRARSVARGLPQPVHDCGGLRLDTASTSEVQRYVFAEPSDHVRKLAACILSPNVPIKVCTYNEVLAALLPSHWRLEPGRFLMTIRNPAFPPPRLPMGLKLLHLSDRPVASVRIMTDNGYVAARGYAAAFNEFFVYDRIETCAAYRRQGLGRALMQALAPCDDVERVHVLVATAAGKPLYDSLGWTTVSPYATAEIPATVVNG